MPKLTKFFIDLLIIFFSVSVALWAGPKAANYYKNHTGISNLDLRKIMKWPAIVLILLSLLQFILVSQLDLTEERCHYLYEIEYQILFFLILFTSIFLDSLKK